MEGNEDNNNGLPPGVPPAGNPPVVPTPPVAPVVPVVPKPPVPPTPPAPANPAPKEEAVPDNTPAAPSNTGNTALDAAIDVMVRATGATQADLDRATDKAFQYGDPNLVDEHFLREKFGAYAEQAIALAKAAVDQAKSNVAALKQTVHDVAGGEANWNNAVALFNQNAPDHMKSAVKHLIDTGKVSEGAKLLMDSVVQAGLLPSQSNEFNGSTVTTAHGALSAEQFKAELATLRKEAGNRSFESGPFADKYNQLIQRRAQGRRLGQ